ncbi:MAG TPA: RNA polymerase sigma factor [Gemmatimonadota bacterium]|nr:RNA polymerase sigma factor [Gemmatimonadota bacterium]
MKAANTEASDGSLVHAALHGDEDAYAALVRRYQNLLYRHAQRMTGRSDEAADIVQASFLKAFGNLSQCRHADRVGAWLFRINANLCKDYLKGRRRQNLRLEATAELAGDDDPARCVELGQLRDRIRQALDRLLPLEREAFVLKHVEGLSYDEMAELLEASVPALKMRVHRAREALQTLLEEYR